MPPPLHSASPTPGPSGLGRKRDRIAEALYAWCIQNHEPGYVFSQEELLNAGIIPDRKLEILLTSTQHLVNRALFKLHDRLGGSIGWELVEEEKAKNHIGLSRDEKMVYACIENSGTAGIWNKTIKNRISAHAQVLERVLKSLTNKGLIKSMSSVKNPGRKMWILAGLQPNEEATGGAWFTNGDLDTSLLQAVATVVEKYVSEQSWEELDPAECPTVNNKRKAPDGGFDDEPDSRSKSARLDNSHHHKGKPTPPPKSYRPFHAGYTKYPTLTEISRHILQTKITGTILPQNAIAQLLDVMVYDNRLFKVSRKPDSGNDADPDDIEHIVMYRSFKTPQDLNEENQLVGRASSHKYEVKKAAMRQQELEALGPGGTSEVPCMSCPVFDICDDGGPINVHTCKYFDQWYLVLAEADREVGVGVYAPKDKGKPRDKGKGKENATIEVEIEADTEMS
ncbi:uncharacterized protein A1O9_07170 [Exophiala aquamarina CBS 119918]|uniref:DNA-directed RNA polymerase III subunit RPC6 n=1 Tax=Exophiala aquamarina CBS 119918 TaxID=1182545 RepID=A0A072PN63_9EURO|nr:uncharacterized protein A1O9_07170 [Exophiala aquamarina CBS 119918]KEF56980.1 hypothetical protein A1O9_07170 [Exophiala aquamarina CBS 119918]